MVDTISVITLSDPPDRRQRDDRPDVGDDREQEHDQHSISAGRGCWRSLVAVRAMTLSLANFASLLN
jgi:hypothetical protein